MKANNDYKEDASTLLMLLANTCDFVAGSDEELAISIIANTLKKIVERDCSLPTKIIAGIKAFTINLRQCTASNFELKKSELIGHISGIAEYYDKYSKPNSSSNFMIIDNKTFEPVDWQ